LTNTKPDRAASGAGAGLTSSVLNMLATPACVSLRNPSVCPDGIVGSAITGRRTGAPVQPTYRWFFDRECADGIENGLLP
jgi:hypothetical protein